MSNQRARETRYQFPPFPPLPRSGQRDKKAKRHRSPTKSTKHTGGLRFLDEFATLGVLFTFFSLDFGIPSLYGFLKMEGELSILYYVTRGYAGDLDGRRSQRRIVNIKRVRSIAES